jgi:hypothetical protein
MARGPQRRRQNEWLRFFLGSPRRFLLTLAGLFILVAMAAPQVAALALSNVLNAFIAAVGPSAGPLLAIAIAVWAIWYVMLRPFTGRRRNHH